MLRCILYICTYINVFIVSNIYLLTPVSCDFYGQSGSKWFFELLFCFSHSESAEINGVFPLTSNESQVRKRCLGVQSMIIIAFEKKKKKKWTMSKCFSFKAGFLILIQTFRSSNEPQREYISGLLACCTWSRMLSAMSRQYSLLMNT